VEKVEKDSERVEPSAMYVLLCFPYFDHVLALTSSFSARFFVTTSRVSQSPLFVVSLVVVVSSVFQVSFTKRLVVFSRLSSRM
jgi:hypothetical protein